MGIDAWARIDDSRGDVVIDPGAKVHAGVFIYGPVTIADGCEIFPGVVIGCAGEHYTQDSDWDCPIEIGAGTRLREHAVIQRAIVGNEQTRVGEECLIMHGSHIAHNCVVHDGVIMAPFAVLGGHTKVFRCANLGIHASTHPHVVIGAYAMVGMGATVLHDLPTGIVATGSPAQAVRANTRGLEKAGIPAEFTPSVMGYKYAYPGKDSPLADLQEEWTQQRERQVATRGLMRIKDHQWKNV